MSSTQKEVKIILSIGFFVLILSVVRVFVFAEGPNDRFFPQQPKQYEATPTSSTPTDNSKITPGTETEIKGASNSDTYSGAPKISMSYFGGRVSSMVTCSCNTDGSSQVTVTGPMGSSGTYLYSSSVKTYARNSVKPSSFLLGKYSSGGVCLIGVTPECSELPITKGTIKYIGTSF